MHGPNAGDLTVLTVRGIPPAGADSSTTRPIRPWAPPPSADQPGSAVALDTRDDRVLSAVWQNGSLWVSGDEACRPAGDASARSCLRLIEVLTAGGVVRQDTTFGTPGADSYYPAALPDGAGHLHLGVAVSTVYRSLQRRDMPGHGVGRHWRFSRPGARDLASARQSTGAPYDAERTRGSRGRLSVVRLKVAARDCRLLRRRPLWLQWR